MFSPNQMVSGLFLFYFFREVTNCSFLGNTTIAKLRFPDIFNSLAHVCDGSAAVKVELALFSKQTHVFDLPPDGQHVGHEAQLLHKVPQSRPVVPHPVVRHPKLARVHQLVPALNHLEAETDAVLLLT